MRVCGHGAPHDADVVHVVAPPLEALHPLPRDEDDLRGAAAKVQGHVADGGRKSIEIVMPYSIFGYVAPLHFP